MDSQYNTGISMQSRMADFCSQLFFYRFSANFCQAFAQRVEICCKNVFTGILVKCKIFSLKEVQ